MKPINLLILCYDYKPLNTVGAHRLVEWVENLHRFGVYPIVVTRKWNVSIKNSNDYYVDELGELEIIKKDNYAEVRIPNRLSCFEKLNAFFTKKSWFLLRKILSLFTVIFRFVPGFNIEKNIYRPYFDRIEDTFNPNIVVASGEPFVLFKYAYQYGKKYNKPYVLDYRDGWSTNVFRQTGLHGLIVKVESFFEHKFLKNAKFSTIASELLKEELEASFGPYPIKVVENGVDLELVNSVEAQKNKEFTIVYTGTIYEKHNVASFLVGFEELLKQYPAKLKFIGINHYASNHNVQLIEEIARKHPNHIEIVPKVSKRESIQFQKSASILLKFSSGPVLKGFYGAKLYEYASINKPILNMVSCKEHAITDFFNKEKIQTFAFDKKTCLKALDGWVEDFKGNRLKTNFLSPDQLAEISRSKQTELFAKFIRNNYK